MAGVVVGSPRGCGIPRAGTILKTPTALAIDVIVQIWLVGRPARSSSFVIVAPQRVPVPQVEVRMTACTPSSFSLAAISLPNLLAFSIVVPLPVVV